MSRVMRTLPDVKSRYSSSIRWERTVGDAERLKKEEVESSRPLIPFPIEEGEREGGAAEQDQESKQWVSSSSVSCIIKDLQASPSGRSNAPGKLRC